MAKKIKEETKVEEVEAVEATETKETVQTKEEVKSEAIAELIELVPYGEDEPNAFDSIETARNGIHESFQKTKLISRILSIVVIAGMIAALVLVVQQDMLCKTFGYVIAGVLLVGMLAFYFITRKKFPVESKDYVKKVSLALNRETYTTGKFSECKYDRVGKFGLGDTMPEHIYSNVIDIASRNIVSGKYNNSPFVCGELALYVAGQRKNSKVVCFLGYYGHRENALHFEDRYIISIKTNGENKCDEPTDIEDLEVLFEEGNFIIYGKKGADFKKDLGSKFLSAVKSLDVSGCFVNFNAVVMAGRTSFYMSYDDTLMAIPFEKAYDPTSRNKFNKDIVAVLDATELLKE